MAGPASLPRHRVPEGARRSGVSAVMSRLAGTAGVSCSGLFPTLPLVAAPGRDKVHAPYRASIRQPLPSTGEGLGRWACPASGCGREVPPCCLNLASECVGPAPPSPLWRPRRAADQGEPGRDQMEAAAVPLLRHAVRLSFTRSTTIPATSCACWRSRTRPRTGR